MGDQSHYGERTGDETSPQTGDGVRPEEVDDQAEGELPSDRLQAGDEEQAQNS